MDTNNTWTHRVSCALRRHPLQGWITFDDSPRAGLDGHSAGCQRVDANMSSQSVISTSIDAEMSILHLSRHQQESPAPRRPTRSRWTTRWRQRWGARRWRCRRCGRSPAAAGPCRAPCPAPSPRPVAGPENCLMLRMDPSQALKVTLSDAQMQIRAKANASTGTAEATICMMRMATCKAFWNMIRCTLKSGFNLRCFPTNPDTNYCRRRGSTRLLDLGEQALAHLQAAGLHQHRAVRVHVH